MRALCVQVVPYPFWLRPQAASRNRTMFEYFEHTADVGIRVRAASLEQLFAEAARALFSLLTANLDAVQPLQQMDWVIPGQQPDELLVDWLDELLFAFSTKHLLFGQFEVTFEPERLRATARGEPVDPDRHQIHGEVKAITYHGLKVEPADGGWLAEVIVDV